ncbi:MAG: GNAT family N-acetyltransferase [Acidiferrobacterales bacterium]
MNQFLARFAAKHMGLGLSSTWVLAAESDYSKAPVVAYYTLTTRTVSREEIPFDKSLPRYPVPVVVLARLAADHRYQGQGIGEKTLITTLRKSVELTNSGLPALGAILDVLDEDALSFYQRYEIFEPFTNDPLRLFAPMTVLQQI